MNIFRRLFGARRAGNAGAALREVTAARQGAAGGLQISGRADADGNGAVLTIGTVEFEIFQDVGRLGDSIQRVGRGAMRMPTSVYPGVLRELMRTVSAVYGDESEQVREIVSAPLYCGTCGFAFPDSYKMQLLGVLAAYGAVAGVSAGVGKSATKGQCPKCRGKDCILVYEYLAPAAIRREDVPAIKAYWHDRAEAWWRRRERKEAICDFCNKTLPAPLGYLHSDRLICEECADGFVDHAAGAPSRDNATLMRDVRWFASLRGQSGRFS
jgi:hypothetical protein